MKEKSIKRALELKQKNLTGWIVYKQIVNTLKEKYGVVLDDK